ncbi:MAG: hypothetical protein AAF666_05400 [Pseudomonadota bacterium]
MALTLVPSSVGAADRAQIDKAAKKGLFSRAFKQHVTAPAGLADLVEDLLARRMIDTLSLARKAGQAVTGAEKVRARLGGGTAAVLLQARDGAPDGRAKLSAVAKAAGMGAIREIQLLNKAELGLAFGREFAIHAALDAGGFATRICAEATRLSGLRGGLQPDGNTEERPKRGLTGTGPAAKGIEDRQAPQSGVREQDDL